MKIMEKIKNFQNLEISHNDVDFGDSWTELAA